MSATPPSEPETDQPVEAPANISPVEILPLPLDRVRRGLPFKREFSEITAWPGQRLRVEMVWTPYSDRWTWEVYHANEDDRRLISHRATLNHPYREVMPYCMFRFETMDETISQITRDTLPDVQLVVYPGPEGGDFLPDAGVSDAEAAVLFELTPESESGPTPGAVTSGWDVDGPDEDEL